MGLLTSTQFHILIRIMHGEHMKMIVRTKWQGCILITKIITVEIISQYVIY
jgi:hypothetical protein